MGVNFLNDLLLLFYVCVLYSIVSCFLNFMYVVFMSGIFAFAYAFDNKYFVFGLLL